MANMLENYGLGFLTESEDTLLGFLAYIGQEGRAIAGYYGCPYLTHSVGNVEVWLRTEKTPDGEYTVTGFDTHCGGPCVWEMIHTGIDITPKSEEKLSRTIMFRKENTAGGMLPISLINADVLPSLLKDDKITAQMVALPLTINYYEDEDAYAEAQPEDEHGKKWMIANGALIPLEFLYNHTPGRYESQKEYVSDCYVQFRAEVKALYHGSISLNGESHRTFIRCFAETEYGALEFDHSIDQVPQEQRNKIKEGAIISGTCILSGDVAIKEYENGRLCDPDHNLQLLRYTFVKGEPERLRAVLTEDAVYETDAGKKRYFGPDEIIDRFSYVLENRSAEHVAHLATIVQAEGEDMEFPVGTRCIALASGEGEPYDSVAFLALNEEGKISKIRVSNDCRYRFEIDQPQKPQSFTEKIKLSDHIIEPLLLRAKFFGIIDDAVDEAAILAESDWDFSLKDNAQQMLEALQANPQENVEEAFRNVLGYLFAKAIEQSYNETRPNPKHETRLTASYSPSEAFAGKLTSTLDEAGHAVLERAMRLGKEFYADFKAFVYLTEAQEDEFISLFQNTAVIVQRLGQLYSQRCFGDR